MVRGIPPSGGCQTIPSHSSDLITLAASFTSTWGQIWSDFFIAGRVGGFKLYLTAFVLIYERYSYLVWLTFGSATFSIKYNQEFCKNCPLKSEYLSLSLWVLFNIKILYLASHWGGIRG
jgi:hypothetical protein